MVGLFIYLHGSNRVAVRFDSYSHIQPHASYEYSAFLGFYMVLYCILLPPSASKHLCQCTGESTEHRAYGAHNFKVQYHTTYNATMRAKTKSRSPT